MLWWLNGFCAGSLDVVVAHCQEILKWLIVSRVGNSLNGFLSESLVVCQKHERFAEKSERFAHFW